MATNPLLQTYDRPDHEAEMAGAGLTKEQSGAIATGVERVSTDTNKYYEAILEIWQRHENRLDSIDGLLDSINGRLASINGRLASIERTQRMMIVTGVLGFAATIALGVVGLVN